MHIKTQYGDAGTLKVTLQKDENDPYYNVIVKSKQQSKDWKIVAYYKYKSLEKAKAVFRRIYEEF